MRLYDNVCITCKKNRAEMPSQDVHVPQRQNALKETSQRPSRGIITVSSWQGNPDQQMQQQNTRSWPSSYNNDDVETVETCSEGTVPHQEPKRRSQSVSGDFTGDFKIATAAANKPLIHHQRHSLKNKFHFLNTLGEGTYGKVKLAIDKGTGEHVALKYIKKTKIQDETDQARIRREIQILSSLKHEHIVNVREVFEKKDKIVLVMDYAPGGELYDYLNMMGKLTEEEARRIFRQIVSAVHHCHENGVVHRDLKLENIVLDSERNVKIGDFGLSNYFQHNSKLSTFCGSPLYASPEIVNGKPYHGPEVDVWSLGVILYTLVYGAMPFESSNVAILRQQISHGLYSEPIQASEAAGLIHHMLTVTPSRRATMEDILHHWWVNFNYPNMPNSMPYKPDPELQDTALDLAADMNSMVLESLAYPVDNRGGNVSSDSDVELDFGQSLSSVRTTPNIQKDSTSSSPEAGNHISDEHQYRQSRDNISEPASVPTALSKLPQEVLEILLKGCSKKTLKALFGAENTSSRFDTDISRCVYTETPKDGERENGVESSDFVQKSHTMSESEKRPTRGILKRKGKFSGGDSGCVINEEMSRHEDISAQDADNLHQKSHSSGANDAFVMNECTSNLISNDTRCSLHDNSCTVISHSALHVSSCPQYSQHVHHRKYHRHSEIPQSVQYIKSSQDIPHSTDSPKEHTPGKDKLNVTCDCESTVDSAKAVALPKSILKNCKKPSLEDGLKRLSISSFGSSSSVDMFDLSYDSADSGHVVNPRPLVSPTRQINHYEDTGFGCQGTFGSNQVFCHTEHSKHVAPVTSSRSTCEARQRSKSH